MKDNFPYLLMILETLYTRVFNSAIVSSIMINSQSQPAIRQHTHTDVKSFESFLIYTGHTTPRIIKNNNTEYPYRKGLKNRCAMDK